MLSEFREHTVSLKWEISGDRMDEGNPLIIRTHCHQYLHPFICLYLSLACTYQASSVFVLALHFCVLTIF